MGKKYTLYVEDKEVDKKGLKERFDKYNQMYFGGKLGKCSFFWELDNHGYRWYGTYVHYSTKTGEAQSKIGITRNVHWTEETLKELLVHEMLHMYIRTVEGKWHDGILGHGRRFRAHCRRLQRDYGLNIRAYQEYEPINIKKAPPRRLWEKVLMWLIDW